MNRSPIKKNYFGVEVFSYRAEEIRKNMEVDQPGSAGASVMASAGTSGSVSVSLHPLVIMNISEHWTRVRAQEGKVTQGFCHKKMAKQED